MQDIFKKQKEASGTRTCFFLDQLCFKAE